MNNLTFLIRSNLSQNYLVLSSAEQLEVKKLFETPFINSLEITFNLPVTGPPPPPLLVQLTHFTDVGLATAGATDASWLVKLSRAIVVENTLPECEFISLSIKFCFFNFNLQKINKQTWTNLEKQDLWVIIIEKTRTKLWPQM